MEKKKYVAIVHWDSKLAEKKIEKMKSLVNEINEIVNSFGECVSFTESKKIQEHESLEPISVNVSIHCKPNVANLCQQVKMQLLGHKKQ